MIKRDVRNIGMEENSMHMADALITPATAGVMSVCSLTAAAYSVRKVQLDTEIRKVPVMGIMGAFVFSAQMINFTIPGTGASGHLCGGMLLSAILGPYAGFLTMSGILLIQALMFADGGLLALGCNVWNMAFYGCFIGSFLIWNPLMKKGMSKAKIVAASVLGGVLTVEMGAFSVVLETVASGVTELTFADFSAVMLPIHLAIGVAEGLITSAILLFIYEARPELLAGSSKPEEKAGWFSFKKTLAILAGIAVLLGGGLSLAASSNPDGLEWSLERLTDMAGIEHAAGSIYQIADRIQKVTSILPDYMIRDSQGAQGTVVSGILGCLIVALVCVGACRLFKFFRRNKEA